MYVIIYVESISSQSINVKKWSLCQIIFDKLFLLCRPVIGRGGKFKTNSRMYTGCPVIALYN